MPNQCVSELLPECAVMAQFGLTAGFFLSAGVFFVFSNLNIAYGIHRTSLFLTLAAIGFAFCIYCLICYPDTSTFVQGRTMKLRFDSGYWGFKVCETEFPWRVTHVESFGQAKRLGVEIGFKITEVDGTKVIDGMCGSASTRGQCWDVISDEGECGITFVALAKVSPGRYATWCGTREWVVSDDFGKDATSKADALRVERRQRESFWDQALGFEYITFWTWNLVVFFMYQFINGFVHNEMQYMGDPDPPDLLTNMFNVLTMGLPFIVMIPLSYVIDNYGFGWAFMWTQVFTVGYHACLVFGSLKYQFLTIIMAVIARISYWGVYFIYLGWEFTFENNFGALSGMTDLASGFLCFIQDPINDYIVRKCDGNYAIVNYVFLILSVVLLLYPSQMILRDKTTSYEGTLRKSTQRHKTGVSRTLRGTARA